MSNLRFAVHTFLATALTTAAFATVSFAQTTGKEIFQQRCLACHGVGEGRRVGPDLAGVNDRRAQGWLMKFIKSSQTVVNSGDAVAKALLDEYKIVMPDQALSDAQIKQVLDYIKGAGDSAKDSTKDSTAAKAASTPAVVSAPIQQDEIIRGQNLFQGTVRFSKGGPSCISCHHVKNDAVIGGGILAKELTTVFSRMGGEGVRAILGGAPFPVMQAAYKDKPFSDDEIRALVGFLQHADKEHAYQQPRDYGWGLFSAGICGVFLLLGFYWLIGLRRKSQSVNQDIYDRQVKSTDE